MALYEFLGGDLGDVNRYKVGGAPATILPSAGDDVSGLGATATSGSIDVNSLKDAFTLAAGTVTAKQTDDVQVGNVNNVGGSATMTVDGTVDFATVFKNVMLTADTIANVLQGRGGNVDLTKDYDVGLGAAGSTNTIDVDMVGGTLNVDGALNLLGAQTEVSITDSATLNIKTLTFGAGKTGISAGTKSTINISGVSSIKVEAGDGFGAGNESVINATGLDIAVEGTSTIVRASIGVGSKSKVTVNNVDIKTFGALNVGGSGVAEAEFTAQDIKNIGTLAIDGSTLKAKSITFGDATAKADECGNWTYTGNSGLFPIRSNGFVSIADTFELKNQNDQGILLDPTVSTGFGGSMHVGGTSKVASGQLLVDGSGKILGHGKIEASSITVNGSGYIEAHEGKLVLDGNITGSGTLKIDDAALLQILDNAEVDVNYMTRSDSSLADASILRLDQPAGFTGTLGGLAHGDSVQIKQSTLDAWSGLKNTTLAHTEIVGGKLELTFSDQQKYPGQAAVRTIDLDGDMNGKAFAIRFDLPTSLSAPTSATKLGYTALDFVDKSPKIVTHVDGTPTNGANPYLDALVSGWAAWSTSGDIRYYFGSPGDIDAAVAIHGETFSVQCDDTSTAIGTWTGVQMLAFESAIDVFESVCGLNLTKALTIDEANIVWWQTPDANRTYGSVGISEIPAFRPDGVTWQVFTTDPAAGFDHLQLGGRGKNTIMHELGHTLGLAHPHDGGAEADHNKFPGVLPAADGGTPGTNAQNQGVYTVMSYNAGLNDNLIGGDIYGDQGGLGAFDIAALQILYGKNMAFATGDDTYTLQSLNVEGTGWCCIWDAGGNDTISNENEDDGSTIDLRQAPLLGVNAGGYISSVNGIQGGFTVANGAIIENAIGGKGVDKITGNEVANKLEGGEGNDIILAGLDNDTLIGNAGADTLNGEGGSDTADYSDSPAGVTVTLGTKGAQTIGKGGDAQGDKISNIENLIGSDFADILTGNTISNSIFGRDGDDVIKGLERTLYCQADQVNLKNA